MSQDGNEPTVEELQARLADSESRLQALERTKVGLLSDLQKRKGVERLAKAAGIDLSADDAEDRITEILNKAQASAQPSSVAPAALQQPPASQPATAMSTSQGDSPGTPSNAVEEALRVQLSSMQTQLQKMEEKLENERKEKDRERRARLEEYKKSVVMGELEKAGCKRSAHVYALRGKQFRLLDDEETVVFGSEDNPISVTDAISNIEQDEEYSIYFPGTGATGSGLPSYRSSIPTGDNPFTKSGSNATRAAEIIASDRALAKRLVQQARARGDLDPILAKHVG